MANNNGGSRISQRGRPTLGVDNLLFGIIFAENCVRLKKIEPRRGARPSPPIDPPLDMLMLSMSPIHENLDCVWTGCFIQPGLRSSPSARNSSVVFSVHVAVVQNRQTSPPQVAPRAAEMGTGYNSSYQNLQNGFSWFSFFVLDSFN